jgi:hypothetical protein
MKKLKNISGRFCFLVFKSYILYIKHLNNEQNKNQQDDPPYNQNKLRSGVKQCLSRWDFLPCKSKRKWHKVQQELLQQEASSSVPQPTIVCIGQQKDVYYRPPNSTLRYIRRWSFFIYDLIRIRREGDPRFCLAQTIYMYDKDVGYYIREWRLVYPIKV